MSKRRKSVTIDEHLADEVDRRSEINFSGLVNDLLDSYLSEGNSFDSMKAALTVRLDRIESEIEQKEKQLNQLREEREKIEELIEEQEKKCDPQLEEALNVLQNTPKEKLYRENEAVKNWARKIGIPPEKLVEKVKEYDPSDESQ